MASPRVNHRGVPAADLKAWLYFRQGGRCVLCGEAIDLSIPQHQYGSATFEHVKPLVHGGGKGRTNLALSHWECNRLRRDERRLKLLRPHLDAYPKIWIGWQRMPPRTHALGFNFTKGALRREKGRAHDSAAEPTK